LNLTYCIAAVGEQGDQIGRIFANWAIVYLRQVFKKNTEVAQILAQHLLTVTNVYYFRKKHM
jgi:hypothetical protein